MIFMKFSPERRLWTSKSPCIQFWKSSVSESKSGNFWRYFYHYGTCEIQRIFVLISQELIENVTIQKLLTKFLSLRDGASCKIFCV